MKRFVIILLLTLLPFPLIAQSTVKKLPGEPTIFAWTFTVADEPKISGFRLYSASVQSGPFANLSSNASSALRTLTIPAAFPAGSIKVYYVVRSYFTTGSGTVESSDSNSVEVELRVPSATALGVK